MNTVPVSSRLERLLLASVADAELREDVAGDLAQEFARRVETQGPLEARRWYRWEALRTIPHLLGHSAKRLSAGELREVAVALSASTAAMVILCMAVVFAVSTSTPSTIVSPSLIDSVLKSPREAGAIFGCLFSTGGPLLGGYVAARASSRAPLVTGVLCGAVWSILFIVIAAAPFAPDYPTWLVVCGPWLILSGTILGSVVRVEVGGIVKRSVDEFRDAIATVEGVRPSQP